jgi:tetratricopeptide (TPR) repeat protein
MDGTTQHTESKDPVAEMLRGYAQNILVVVFGLLPIFFMPSQSAPFEYAKIMFVVVGVLGAFVLYSLSALRSGGVQIGVSYTIVGAWVLALTAFVSSLLSGDFKDSLMGDSMSIHTTSFLVLLALIMSAWALVDAGKRAVMRLYMLLATSTIILVFFHVIRLIFGIDTFSFGIFTTATATPVGSWNDLALFLGLSVILALVALEQLPLTPLGRSLFVVVVMLSLFMLGVINFFVVWLVLGLTSLTIVVYALTKDKFSGTQLPLVRERSFNGTSLICSLVVFVVTVLFIIGGASLGGSLAKWTGISYVEVRPSLEATAGIARNVYNENAFLGTGPNKFVDAWRLYKDPAINTTVFWNTDFIAGNGYVTTFFITSGVLGMLAWLFFFGTFLTSGVRMLMYGNEQDRMWYFIGVSSLVSSVYIWGMSVIYVPGAVMLMLGALCVGVTVTASRALAGRSTVAFSLVTDRRTGFVFTLIVIGIIVSSVGGLYIFGKHYGAAEEHNQGIVLRDQGDSEGALARFRNAYALYPSDVYMRRTGEIQFRRLSTILGLTQPTVADQAEFRQVVQDGIATAEEARMIDPNDPENWMLLGSMYSVLIGFDIEGVYGKAHDALVRAKELNPKSPVTVLSLAILEGRVGNYASARTYTEEAIALRPNYTDAYFYLSQIDIATGNVEGALRATQSIITLEPQNPIRYYQLGILEAARNNADGAIDAFERAIVLDPNYANAHYLLALAYDQKGRTADTLRELEKVLELNPENTEIIALVAQLQKEGALRVQTPTLEDGVSLGTEGAVTSDNGTVATDGAPNTTLVSPVNTVPEKRTETTEGGE